MEKHAKECAESQEIGATSSTNPNDPYRFAPQSPVHLHLFPTINNLQQNVQQTYSQPPKQQEKQPQSQQPSQESRVETIGQPSMKSHEKRQETGAGSNKTACTYSTKNFISTRITQAARNPTKSVIN